MPMPAWVTTATRRRRRREHLGPARGARRRRRARRRGGRPSGTGTRDHAAASRVLDGGDDLGPRRSATGRRRTSTTDVGDLGVERRRGASCVPATRRALGVGRRAAGGARPPPPGRARTADRRLEPDHGARPGAAAPGWRRSRTTPPAAAMTVGAVVGERVGERPRPRAARKAASPSASKISRTVRPVRASISGVAVDEGPPEARRPARGPTVVLPDAHHPDEHDVPRSRPAARPVGAVARRRRQRSSQLMAASGDSGTAVARPVVDLAGDSALRTSSHGVAAELAERPRWPAPARSWSRPPRPWRAPR